MSIDTVTYDFFTIFYQKNKFVEFYLCIFKLRIVDLNKGYPNEML